MFGGPGRKELDPHLPSKGARKTVPECLQQALSKLGWEGSISSGIRESGGKDLQRSALTDRPSSNLRQPAHCQSTRRESLGPSRVSDPHDPIIIIVMAHILPTLVGADGDVVPCPDLSRGKSTVNLEGLGGGRAVRVGANSLRMQFAASDATSWAGHVGEEP